MCNIINRFVFFVIIVFLQMPIIEAQAQDTSGKLVLTITSPITEMPVYMSAEIQFELLNPTSNKISNIPNLDYYGDRGVDIYIRYQGLEKKILFPTLELNQDDCIGCSYSFNLEPGQTAKNSLLLGMEWGKNVHHLFSESGTYVVYGSHTIPGYETIQSNEIEILVRQPVTNNEAEAVRLLTTGKTLVFFNKPRALRMEDDSNLIINTAQSIKTIFEMNPPTPFKGIAKKNLLYWRQIEINAKKYNIEHMKRRGFDKLGLVDLNLEE